MGGTVCIEVLGIVSGGGLKKNLSDSVTVFTLSALCQYFVFIKNLSPAS